MGVFCTNVLGNYPSLQGTSSVATTFLSVVGTALAQAEGDSLRGFKVLLDSNNICD